MTNSRTEEKKLSNSAKPQKDTRYQKKKKSAELNKNVKIQSSSTKIKENIQYQTKSLELENTQYSSTPLHKEI